MKQSGALRHYKAVSSINRMTHREILLARNYRQFPRPQAPWLIYQEWFKVLFLHAPVDKELLLPLIPEGTVLDLYEGQAWISILAFTVRNAHPRFALPMPYLSNFHEINLRTYVRSKDGDHPGITFLDINASKVLPSYLGRTYGLPYRPASIFRYQNERKQQIISKKSGGCNMNLDYTPSAPLASKKVVDIWLTERYIAYQQLTDGLYSYPIQHREWPLKEMALAGDLRYNFQGLRLTMKDIFLMHYADNIQVLLWPRMRHSYSK